MAAPAVGLASTEQASAAQPATAPPAPRRRISRLARLAVLVIVLGVGIDESCVADRASDLASTVPLQDFAGLQSLWSQYEALSDWSAFGWGVQRLERTLINQTMVLAERVMANYRSPQPTVRENQWKAAVDALRRAVALSPNDAVLKASLRNCEGHLFRINGEAAKGRGEKEKLVAQQQFTEAVVAFREAASLKGGWPDPFLGLARTFIYGLEDVDRGADALAQAEKYGHHPGDRETAQLADGYRARGESLARTAQTLKGMTQELDHLQRASAAFREALTRYSTVSAYGNVAVSMRDTQRKLDRIEERITELSKDGNPWE
jgi:tetratricopeptide (TPR) repeat protein